MLFNDFLLLTRIKRPLITKFFQIINRISFNHRREQNKISTTPSNIDWFDLPEANHLYLTVHKKVNFDKIKKNNKNFHLANNVT
jgi:hypothetical protein